MSVILVLLVISMSELLIDTLQQMKSYRTWPTFH